MRIKQLYQYKDNTKVFGKHQVPGEHYNGFLYGILRWVTYLARKLIGIVMASCGK